MMKQLIASLFVLFALAVVARQAPAPKSQLSWVAAQAPEVKRFSEISSQGFTFSLDLVNQGKAERTLTIHASKSGAKP
jgi:hypothetical protein